MERVIHHGVLLLFSAVFGALGVVTHPLALLFLAGLAVAWALAG